MEEDKFVTAKYIQRADFKKDKHLGERATEYDNTKYKVYAKSIFLHTSSFKAIQEEDINFIIGRIGTRNSA